MLGFNLVRQCLLTLLGVFCFLDYFAYELVAYIRLIYNIHRLLHSLVVHRYLLTVICISICRPYLFRGGLSTRTVIGYTHTYRQGSCV